MNDREKKNRTRFPKKRKAFIEATKMKRLRFAGTTAALLAFSVLIAVIALAYPHVSG